MTLITYLIAQIYTQANQWIVYGITRHTWSCSHPTGSSWEGFLKSSEVRYDPGFGKCIGDQRRRQQSPLLYSLFYFHNVEDAKKQSKTPPLLLSPHPLQQMQNYFEDVKKAPNQVIFAINNAS